MTTPSPAIGAFWRAFSDAQASLQALPLRERVGAVSYTHLTLPTIYSV
mgnify:CR=1 FL=1